MVITKIINLIELGNVDVRYRYEIGMNRQSPISEKKTNSKFLKNYKYVDIVL